MVMGFEFCGNARRPINSQKVGLRISGGTVLPRPNVVGDIRTVWRRCILRVVVPPRDHVLATTVNLAPFPWEASPQRNETGLRYMWFWRNKDNIPPWLAEAIPILAPDEPARTYSQNEPRLIRALRAIQTNSSQGANRECVQGFAYWLD